MHAVSSLFAWFIVDIYSIFFYCFLLLDHEDA